MQQVPRRWRLRRLCRRAAVVGAVGLTAALAAAPQVDVDRVGSPAGGIVPTVTVPDGAGGCLDTVGGDRTARSRLPFREGGTAPGRVVQAATVHLAVVATAGDGAVVPGRRLTLTFDITPARGIHVYAPGGHGYRVIAFCVDAPPWLTVHPAVYPPAEIYHFVPLDERVETYRQPFTLRQDVTVPASREARAQLAGRTSFVIGGRLEYQACDDRVCFAPMSVPVAFTLSLAP